jgi:D-3-phosphoglycerate dehydrogenase
MHKFKAALVYVDAPEVPSWVHERLSQGGLEFIVQECANPEEVGRVACDADLVWVFGGGKVVSEDCLVDLKNCSVILRSGSGTDNIPVARATELGIIVANTPKATCETVSDHAIALIFSLYRNIVYQDRRVQKGIWAYRDIAPPQSLAGKNLGFLGFGHIPRRMADKLVGFSFHLFSHDPYVGPGTFETYGVRSVSFEELLALSDILSIHCPLTEETFHLIDESALRQMRANAIIINTARGPLIDEKALYEALSEGRLGGAALDVVETSPDLGYQPLAQLDNVILTPHMAGYVKDYLVPFWEHSVATILEVAQGRLPSSCVNPEVVSRAGHLNEQLLLKK